jgi:hypothetical protein
MATIGSGLTPEIVRALIDPRISLPQLGTVMDQSTSEIQRYDPYRITHRLQADVLEYVANPERTAPEPELGRPDGQTTWRVDLKSRQTGESTCVEMALYPRCMYTPGWQHITLADKRERADDLHKRTQLNHQHWPEEYRLPQPAKQETRKLEFSHGGRMGVLAGGAEAVSVGQSIDSFHGSELPLIEGLSEQWMLLYPTMQNRNEALMVLESTPYEMSRPSSEFYRDLFQMAQERKGRLRGNFYPFTDGKLNRKRWNQKDHMTNEEIRLLERWGHPETGIGLTPEHLAFRRHAMDNIPDIRRNPKLFGVFFPFDPISCWLVSGRGVVPDRAIERQAKHICKPIEEFGPIQANGRPAGRRYKEYNPNAVYALGADAAGHGMDHSAFHILEVWADEWEQVVSFDAHMDYLDFGDFVFNEGSRYGAKVGFERNGVGLGLAGSLRLKD